MSKYPDDLYRTLSQSFNFCDEKKFWRIIYHFDFQAAKILGLDHPCPIYIPFFSEKKWTKLRTIGEKIGFSNEFYRNRLILYDELNRASGIINIVMFLFIIYIIIAINHFTDYQFAFFIDSRINLVNQTLSSSKYSIMWWLISLPFFVALTILVSIFIYLTLVGVPIKLISRLRDTIWSESICTKTVIFVLAELSKDDVLVNPMKRKFLLNRMERLALVTKLIPLNNPYAKIRSKSVDEHFGKISDFIRERKRWVYFPVETTLWDLRNDFFSLAGVYLSGSYGMFSANLHDDLVSHQKELVNKNYKYNQILKIIGSIIPLIFIALIIIIPDKNLPFDKAIEPTLVLIFISWFLLIVDQLASLGVVKGLVDLAKGIKNLE